MRDDAPEIMETDHEKKFLLDPYLDWVAAEGPPVYEGFGLDLLALETGPWPRFDAKGAFCHVKGRGDFCTCYLLELDPGKPTAPVRHLYECFVYVLDGHGSTTIELPDGQRHSFEWAPKALFALPLN
ncbi:MAG: ethanolamine ammonia lyase-activating protein, partial [Alphaproteobacteria bacterium]